MEIIIRTMIAVGLALSPFTAFAQRTATVKADYVYHAPSQQNLQQAKDEALRRARIEAIVAEFGTMVTQINSTTVSNAGGHSAVDFNAVGESQVRGEWIETTGGPDYDISYDEVNGQLVVKVTVEGRIREITGAAVMPDIRVLRGGTDDSCEAESFKDGNDMYLSFTSPVGGYLAVFLHDGDGNSFCLLPYAAQAEGTFRIEANRRYVLFCKETASPDMRGVTDEYVLSCNGKHGTETNVMYCVFSPNVFYKPHDSSAGHGMPRALSADDFHKWLAKCRTADKDMVVVKRVLTITK